MEKKLSIIIPVYNVEQYVEKCLRSCAEQNIPADEYEIIVINDGSTDNSLKIIKKVIAEHYNFILIDKPNGGVSSARNAGLYIAQGEYVWFVDADDWIADNCLQAIVDTLVADHLDILQIGYYSVLKDKLVPCSQKYRKTTNILTPFDYMSLNLFIGGVSFSIFNKKIAIDHAVTFDQDLKLAEDQLFFLSIMYFSKRVRRIDSLFYHYYFNSLSAVNTAKEDDLLLSISKITGFQYRGTFRHYCDELIIQQFLCCLRTINNRMDTLNKYMKNAKIEKITYRFYSIDTTRNKFILLCYSLFGLGFLRFYGLMYSIEQLLRKSLLKL